MLSRLRTSRDWPAIATDTRGAYMHSLWAITTGVVGAVAGTTAPAVMRTTTSRSLPSVTSTSSLPRAVAAHTGSLERSTVATAGASPFHFTEPVIEPVPGAANTGVAVAATATTRASERSMGEPSTREGPWIFIITRP